jgi:hypothetical protein
LSNVDEFQIENDLIVNIYEKYFNKTEMQEIIINSNNFLPFAVLNAKNMIDLLKYIFKGNEKELKTYFEKIIDGTNLDIFEYIIDTGLAEEADIEILKKILNILELVNIQKSP